MKMLSTALVIAGLGLAAAYGAKNADGMVERQKALGLAKMLNKESVKARERLAEKFRERDGKVPAELEVQPTDPPEWAELKAAYDVASTKAGEAAHSAAKYDTVQSPGQRFSDWFGESGGPFGLGMILLIVGAVMARTESRKVALGQVPKQYKGAREAEAIDFGALLLDLHTDVEAAARHAESQEDPGEDDYKELRYLVRNLQFDKVEPLVESRGRVEARYGVAGFAAIFGPFSAGERQLNRAWSALVDQHMPEAADSLARSSRSFQGALAQIERLASTEQEDASAS